MGICYGIELDEIGEYAFGKGHMKSEKTVSSEKNISINPQIACMTKNPSTQKQTIEYIIPTPLTQEEMNINILIDYIMHGLEYDLFPANYRYNGKRWPWGVATCIPSETLLDGMAFDFNNVLSIQIKKVIKYSKSLKGNYGDSGPPQIILNYKDNGFKLIIECYKRNGSLCVEKKYSISREIARMFIRTIIEENGYFYDLDNPTATYETY